MTVGSAHPDTQRAPTPIGFGWVPVAVVAIAVVAVTMAAVYVAMNSEDESSRTATEFGASVVAPTEVHDEDLLMAKLANEGYIPGPA